MELVHYRQTSTSKSLIGPIHGPDGIICDLLERPWEGGINRHDDRNTPGNESTAILPGRYRLIIRWSDHNKMYVIGLLNVPGRGDIEIHIANWPVEVMGCMAPGIAGVDCVRDSRKNFTKLFGIVKDAIDSEEEVWLTTQNDFAEAA